MFRVRPSSSTSCNQSFERLNMMRCLSACRAQPCCSGARDMSHLSLGLTYDDIVSSKCKFPY
eukprot:6205084-Pleurochrysis_carterae.AAC.2